jgi:hypothetical protein
MSCICVLRCHVFVCWDVMYLCVEMSCICVLKCHVFVCWDSCICVLRFMYLCVEMSCICVLRFMYLCVEVSVFASFCDFSLVFWICFDCVVGFFFILLLNFGQSDQSERLSRLMLLYSILSHIDQCQIF